MFQLYVLLVDALRKMRFSINRIVIGKKRNGYYPQQDTFFDILNLANQLHKLKSTHPKGPKREKIYFSKNQVSDLIKLELKHLLKAVKAYKGIIKKDSVDVGGKAAAVSGDIIANKAVNELFRQAQEDDAIISELYDK